MKTDGRPFQVRTGRPVRDDVMPRQPNEIDESSDSQEEGKPRPSIKQAYDDIMSGQQDTDLREQRGVEETVKDEVRKRADSPRDGLDASHNANPGSESNPDTRDTGKVDAEHKTDPKLRH